MKICMLTSGHKPLDNRIFYKEALSLKKKYDEISIVAPSDKDYEKVEGIDIYGIPKWKSTLNRYECLKNLYKRAKEIPADVYHCHEPDALLVGVLLKRHFKKQRDVKVIYDSHEFYSRSFPDHFKFPLSAIVAWVIRIYERIMTRYCAHVITVNQTIVDHFKKIKVPDDKVTILYNCPSLEIFEDEGEKEDDGTGVVICHEGALPFNRGLVNMMEAFKKVHDQYPDTRFLIVGELKDKEKIWFDEWVRETGLSGSIDITGWLPYTEVGKHLTNGDIGILLFQYSRNNFIGLPNKLFNYMRYGIPVVASNFPEIKRVVESNLCGITVEPTDVEQIAQTIMHLVRDRELRRGMGANGKKAILSTYNWAAMEERLFDIYSKLQG